MLTPDHRDLNKKAEVKRKQREPEAWGPNESERLARQGRRPGDRRERNERS